MWCGISVLVLAAALAAPGLSSGNDPGGPAAGRGTVEVGGKFLPAAGPAVASPASGRHGVAREDSAPGSIRQVGADDWEIGQVKLNKSRRTIAFAARIAERDRPLEYALVHQSGKVHESLLATEVPLRDVHVAVLLLHAVGQRPGITVSWAKHGGAASLPLEELLRCQPDMPDVFRPARDAAWIYHGSRFDPAGFAASREGSLIALIHDPAALVNHPAAAALQRDDVFFARADGLPPDGVQVTVTLAFPPPVPGTDESEATFTPESPSP
jgi:hypothetical protein